MTRSRTLMILTVCALMSSGCFFTGGVRDSDLAELDTHVQSLNQRIDTLEATRAGSLSASVGTSAAGSSVAFKSGTISSTTGAGTSGSQRGEISEELRHLPRVVRLLRLLCRSLSGGCHSHGHAAPRYRRLFA